MTTLYKLEVTSLDRTPLLLRGEPVTVDGVAMVRMPHGSIVPAVGFYPTLEQARHAAADKMESLLEPVHQQLAELRQEVPA